eukprot:7156644-Prorocentrum_lima.AAC.1
MRRKRHCFQSPQLPSNAGRPCCTISVACCVIAVAASTMGCGEEGVGAETTLYRALGCDAPPQFGL